MHRKMPDKTSNSPLMEICGLSMKKGNFLLENISFQVFPGEILAIIGKNGSGKTMLLESIAGFHQIRTGEVLLEGKDMSGYPLHERQIGYLYQDYSLFPHMTARENIAYGLRWKKIRKKERKLQVEHMAVELEITSVLDQYPSTLSGGEQQRVALARALVTEPKLLLLDEPFCALDPSTKQKLYALIQKIHKDFLCTIVFVTHDFQEAEILAERIGVLYGGRLRGIVESDKLFTTDWDEEVREFLGKE